MEYLRLKALLELQFHKISDGAESGFGREGEAGSMLLHRDAYSCARLDDLALIVHE